MTRHNGDVGQTAPTISGDRVRLRPVRDTDIARIVQMCRDPQSQAYTTIPADYTEENGHDWIRITREEWAKPDGVRAFVIEAPVLQREDADEQETVAPAPDTVQPTLPEPRPSQHAGLTSVARERAEIQHGTQGSVDPKSTTAIADAAPESGSGEWQYVGQIDLRPTIAQGHAEIGYTMHPDARGNGYVTEAVKLICQWWFAHGGSSVVWNAYCGNLASWKAAWTNGFKYRGIASNRYPARQADGVAHHAYEAILTSDDQMSPAAPWHQSPELFGRNVTLRPWRDADAESFETATHPDHFTPPSTRFLAATAADTIAGFRDDAAFGRAAHWCIADASTDAPLGDIMLGYRDFDATEAMLGFQLFPSATGRGLAQDAVDTLTEYAFRSPTEDGLGLRALRACCVTDNDASILTLSRCGFRRTGITPASDMTPTGTPRGLMQWWLPASTCSPADGVHVVRLAATDWRRLRSLRIRALTENPESFCANLTECIARPDEFWHDEATHSTGFVAVADGLDVGLVQLLFPPAPESDDTASLGSGGPTAVLESLWVDPTVRGMGVGAALIDACATAATRRGHSTLTLYVTGGSLAARELYARCGFRETPRTAADEAFSGGCDTRMDLTLKRGTT